MGGGSWCAAYHRTASATGVTTPWRTGPPRIGYDRGRAWGLGMALMRISPTPLTLWYQHLGRNLI